IEIQISSPVGCQLLLEGEVSGIDPGIVVIAIKNRHSRLEGESGIRRRREWDDIGPNRGRTIRADKAARGIAGKQRLLLNAVGGNSAYLCKHVLLGVVNAPACPEERLLIVLNVPGQANPGLEHCSCVGDISI